MSKIFIRGEVMEKNAKIYVTGHTGMVGSAIVRQLKANGYTNIITKTHSQLDLTRQAEVEKFFSEEKPEYVFVAAAKVGGIKANSTYPVEFATENAYIGLNIITAAHNNSVKKLLYLSSACCYPNNAQMPVKECDLFCGAPEITNQAYALSKNLCLRLCSYYKKEYGDDFTAVMPANCYGEGDSFDPQNSHVIPSLIMKYHNAKLNQTPQIELWGSGKPLREFIYVDDLADACIFVINNYSGEEHINIGTGEEISILELAQLVSKTVGYEGKIVCDTSKPDGKMRNFIDSSKLAELGWKPKYTIQSGLTKIYNFYLESVIAGEKNAN